MDATTVGQVERDIVDAREKQLKWSRDREATRIELEDSPMIRAPRLQLSIRRP